MIARLFAACAVCGSLLLAAADARAEPAPFIAWDAPPDCPDRDAFAHMVETHLAGAAPAQPLHVEVQVEKRGRRYRLTLLTTSKESHGERTLTGSDCAVLAETAALTLALAIAPAGAAPPPAQPVRAAAATDGETPPVPGARPADDRGSVAREAPGRELALDLAIRPLVSLDVGSFPDPAAGTGLAVATRISRFRVEAYAAYWFEQRARLDEAPDDGADLRHLAGGLRGCYGVPLARAEIGLCAGGELTRTWARGFGGLDTRTGAWTWLSLVGGPAIALAVTNRLSFRTDAEIVGRPRTRPKFVFPRLEGGPDLVHRPAWVGARVSAGLELSFR